MCRLLSEGPRLSSSVPSLVQHDAAKQPPSSVAEVSQPPPYHHPASSAVPSQPLPPPQQSLYAADYSLQQPHLVPQQTHHHMTTPSSTPGSWTQNPSVVSQSQPPPLHAYSVPPLQQQRYVSLNASDVVCVSLFSLCTQHFHAPTVFLSTPTYQYYRGTPNGFHDNTGSCSTPLSTSIIVSTPADVGSAAPALISNHQGLHVPYTVHNDNIGRLL